MRNFLLIASLFFLPFVTIAQEGELYIADWKKADSLFDRGLPQSALKIAEAVYAKAKAKNQPVQMLKAQIYLLKADLQTKEDGYVEAIKRAETEISNTGFPVDAVWQSIAAQLYWNYYQQNRWKIVGRTSVSSSNTIDDFEQWDATRFYNKIAELYLGSLSRAGELKAINIATYDPILVKGINTRALRPTLYDLLAFRALAYFANDEKDVTKPAFSFTISDAAAFDDAIAFINHSFKTQDTSSLQWKALGIYKQLLSLHINDGKPDAFIDADLHRLAFVYQSSVHENKKELYIRALERIEEKHAGNPLSALAGYRIAEVLMGDQSPITPYGYRRVQPLKDTGVNNVAIKKRLEEIIARYPKSEGGSLASAMLAQLERKELSLQTEEAVLPGEPSKALITYRNIAGVWFRIVPVTIDQFRMRYQRGDDKWHTQLLKTQPVKSWSEQLPAAADLKSHNTEVKIDELPPGMYALVASSNEQFSTGQSIITASIFQVTRLSIIIHPTEAYVLDRRLGNTISDATVDFYKEEYKSSGYELVVQQSVRSGKDGVVKLGGNNQHYRGLLVKKDDDQLFLNTYFSHYDREHQPQAREQTFFFTDRSIYRPGQTIYFKGIMMLNEKDGRQNSVISNRETEVIFYDANNQKIASRKLTTNEYGSISGNFVAPQGVLTGNMRICNTTGCVDLSVEEYKRPKFAVAFDTIRTTYTVNEKITVTGKARAYAGNVVDGATVKYRVERNARWPIWWMYYYWGQPASSAMEITNGITTTNSDGKFSISFEAIPDKTINPESLPTFTYTIHAEVTDINGETRAGSMSVNAGYTSVILTAELPSKASPAQLDSIRIRSLNLNGVFVPVTANVRIDKLKEPAVVLRKRLWETPDQFIMDSVTFRRHFPIDEYKNEADHTTWPEETTVFEKAINTTKEGGLAIPSSAWQTNGWYRIELTTTDKNGKEIKERKFVNVWDKNNRGKTTDPLLVVPEEQSKEPGSIAEVNTTSAYPAATIIRSVQGIEGKTDVTAIEYTGTPLSWTKTIAETDRGGIALQYIMIRDNRIYREQAMVQVPFTNKELNIKWETHRDKLQPGSKETWTMVVSGNKKEKLAAEMVATLYDASLDAFRAHQWQMPGLYPPLFNNIQWVTPGFGLGPDIMISQINMRNEEWYEKRYDEIALENYLANPYGRRMYKMAAGAAAPEMAMAQDGATAGTKFTPPVVADQANMMVTKEELASAETTSPVTTPAENITLRKDFRETAFFYPHLKTDADGNVRVEFTIPEALTEWKLMALAHTKDVAFGLFDGTVKTQKDLMVMPGLPRFLRQGDDIVISSKISNLTTNSLNGTAILHILDAQTLKPLALPFRLTEPTKNFNATAGQSTPVSWNIHVPESLYEPVIIRITASAGNFTDGEENMLPVLTNRMLVTETLPLWINGSGEKNFSFDKLKYADTSKTLSHYNLALEYTGNPAWYAVQALPYLMEYPYECAEQAFNRYYATALAAHIVSKNPKIEEIFRSWRTLDTTALLSNLEKNQELKSALLEETPWVMEAENESEQKRRIAMLFETHKLARTLDASVNKLKDMMLPEGGFPWFKGMRPDRYITQYIVTGLARLQHLGVSDSKSNMQHILDKALPYLDKQIADDYDVLVKNKAKLPEQHIGYHQMQYLYMRSFFKTPMAAKTKTAFEYYKQQSVKYWPKFNAYMKGMTALALHRHNDAQTPQNILASLKETAITKEEMGMYWIQPGHSYWWYEAPIETQALLIEAFSELAKGSADIDRMKIWLLKQKQTQNWNSTKATADACYALLLSGTQWLTNEPTVVINLGEKNINSSEITTQKGTGNFKVNYPGSEIKPSMGDVKLSVQNNAGSTSWGAVYWQYFENMDKISFAATPLVVKKQLFIELNTARGPELEPITANNTLKVGDKVKVRIEIIVDRDMEYVHMKDMRAAAFEPVNVISSYKWQNGLGYYEATKDASTNFFFNYLRKGKYVFEYPMHVTNRGDFSNGITTIQCMYAPEFSSHTEGMRITVR